MEKNHTFARELHKPLQECAHACFVHMFYTSSIKVCKIEKVKQRRIEENAKKLVYLQSF